MANTAPLGWQVIGAPWGEVSIGRSHTTAPVDCSGTFATGCYYR